ncbi:5'-3' exonuclease [Streptomyces katrae]|uniref:5'-3' exonuclease n=1 Tax=Streptomyces katrae TaxID=68223 RepID=UPI0004C10C1D|nr:5'-3' exonuclease H3TH domain-containing protein [Streptomyces katrae]
MPSATVPLIFVDGHHLLYRAHFGFPKGFHSLDGTDVTGAFGFVALLRKAHREHCTGHEVLVVFDAEGGAADRAQTDGGYKANRAAADPSPIQALAPLKEMLDQGGVRWLERPGAEGDDVLTTIATRTAADGRAVVVLSGDRDFYSLLSADGVRILNLQAPPGRQFVTARSLPDRYGMTPAQWADFRSLTGDPSDNLAGVGGVGPVTAARLLAGGRRLEHLPATAPGRLAEPLGLIREPWGDVLRERSLLRLNCGLPIPQGIVAGAVTPELTPAAVLMKAAGLW